MGMSQKSSPGTAEKKAWEQLFQGFSELVLSYGGKPFEWIFPVHLEFGGKNKRHLELEVIPVFKDKVDLHERPETMMIVARLVGSAQKVATASGQVAWQDGSPALVRAQYIPSPSLEISGSAAFIDLIKQVVPMMAAAKK